MKTTFWLLAAMLAVLVLLAACSDEEEETVVPTTIPASTTPTPAPTPTCPGGALDATWGCIQNLVFTASCASSGCHSGSSRQAGLSLTAQDSPSIVGRASTQGLALIDPTNPDGSYLIRKLEGGPGISGSRMPLGQTPLPDATIQFIRAWVTDGATVP